MKPDTQVADRLAKLLGMCGSDRDGEVVNAARAADRLVRSTGLTWFDVIAIQQRVAVSADDDWHEAAAFCIKHSHRLSAREYDFIVSLESWRGTPTDKQLKWLFAIYNRVQRAA